MDLKTLNPINPAEVQKPYTCAFACIKSEARRRGTDKGYSLEEMGILLGGYIDKEHKDMFMTPLRRRGRESKDERIGLLYKNYKKTKLQNDLNKELELIAEPWDAINYFAKKELEDIRNSNICEIDNLPEYKKSLRKLDLNIALHNAESDILEKMANNVGVKMNYWTYPFRGEQNGHYVMVTAYDKDKKRVYVMDPDPNTPSYWHNSLLDFLPAMLPIWNEPQDDGSLKSNNRGFIFFKGPMRTKKEPQERIDGWVKQVPEYKPIVTKIKVINPLEENENRLSGK